MGRVGGLPEIQAPAKIATVLWAPILRPIYLAVQNTPGIVSRMTRPDEFGPEDFEFRNPNKELLFPK
jgi:hypothetical protein